MMCAISTSAPPPRSPWPQHPDANPPADPEKGGAGLGVVGKALGALMDLPRPTRNKPLSGEQVDEIRAALQPGDVLLESNDEYPGWELNAKLLLKSDWVHAALYIGNDTIVDATTERNGVNTIDVKGFCKTHHLAVLRPQYKTEDDRRAALQYAQDSIGIPYDYDWRLDNKTLYCTEFVANALQAGPNPINVPLTHVKLARSDMYSPQSFMKMPELTPVWSNGSCYYLNLAQRARPFALQAGLGTAAWAGVRALGASPGIALAAGIAVGGGLFIGSMWRIMHRKP